MLTPLRIVVAAVLLLGSVDTTAICLAGHVYEVYVGDKASDATCTYDSIQEALSATYTCATTIRVTRMHTYTTQHLTLNGTTKPLTLQGEADGVTCYQLSHCLPVGGCHAATTQPLVTLDGNNSLGSVLTITGNSTLTLRDLTITRGSASVSGGGIQFDGTGALALDTTTVSLNYAGYGGGINVNGNGGPATLTLDANSLVLSNVAGHDGGGIRLTGQARLLALQPQTLIGYNQAPNGYGGGIAVIGPARADIGSPGLNGVAAVYYNSANSGAGIAVIDNGGGEAVLREFATSASQPTAISDNTASSHGGGVFVTGQADACLFAPYLVNNIAEDGAAIYYSAQVAGSGNIRTDSGIYVNGGSPSRLGVDCGPELVADLGGSKVCRPYDANCSAFVGSTTQHADGTPTPGAAISIGSDSNGGNFVAARFRLRTSVAGYGILGPNGATLDASHCLITDNGVSTYLIYGGNGIGIFHNCTVANNVIDGGVVFWYYYLPIGLDLANDIIDQPGSYTAEWDAGGGGVFSVSDVLTNNVAGLPSGNPSIVQGLPTFVDAANGDYHLAPVAQKALDFGNSGIVDFDLDGGSPNIDLQGIPNFLGFGDLGAYERQNLFYNCGNYDSIYCDGFNH